MPFSNVSQLVGTSPVPEKTMSQVPGLTVTTTPQTFEDLGVAAADIAAAPSILICPRTGDIEVDLEGNDLSAGEGFPITQGAIARISYPDTLTCKFISAGSVTAVAAPQEYTQ